MERDQYDFFSMMSKFGIEPSDLQELSSVNPEEDESLSIFSGDTVTLRDFKCLFKETISPEGMITGKNKSFIVGELKNKVCSLYCIEDKEMYLSFIKNLKLTKTLVSYKETNILNISFDTSKDELGEAYGVSFFAYNKLKDQIYEKWKEKNILKSSLPFLLETALTIPKTNKEFLAACQITFEYLKVNSKVNSLSNLFK